MRKTLSKSLSGAEAPDAALRLSGLALRPPSFRSGLSYSGGGSATFATPSPCIPELKVTFFAAVPITATAFAMPQFPPDSSELDSAAHA